MRAVLLFSLLAGWGQTLVAQDVERIRINSTSFELVGSELRYQNLTISLPGSFLMTADQGISDQKTGIITLKGNVKIDYYSSQGVVEITAREAVYDQRNRSGHCTEVTAQFAEDVFFVGETVEMIDAGDQFIIENGHMTACNQANPQWALTIKRATIEREGYAFLRGARFKVKDVPILYFPIFIAPAMQQRRSGLLAPDSGQTERNGMFYSQPVYWAPRADMDLTFTPHLYKDAGLRLDLEARYVPSHHTRGWLQGGIYQDRVLEKQIAAGTAPLEDGKPLDDRRFRATWQHDQQLGRGNFRIDVEGGSDFSVDRDYLQDYSRTRIRDYFYRVGYNRPVGMGLFSIQTNRLERVLARDAEGNQTEAVQTLSHLPDLRFFQPNTHLGAGFFTRNYGSATYFDLEDIGLFDLTSLENPTEATESPLTDRMTRYGVEGDISRPQTWGPFVHARWGTRYKGAAYQLADHDEQGQRGSIAAFLETVGPRLQKTYCTGDRRLVHYLDLGLITSLGSENGDPFFDQISFDELDIRLNELAQGPRTTWRLNSRLFSGAVGAVRPLLDMEVRQSLGFEDQPNSPIEAKFRMLNFQGFNGHGFFEYDPEESVLSTSSVYGNVNRGTWTGYGGYVNRHAISESVIAISQWDQAAWRSRFKIAVDYDIDEQTIKSQEFMYGYQGQCVGMALNYVKSPFDSSRLKGRDFFQFRINLRNLSEFGTKF